jgi:hypothetical protein
VKDLTPPAQPLKTLAVLIAPLFFLAADLRAQTNAPPPPAATNAAAPAAASSVPAGREGARQAQRLYMLGKYAEAAEAYLLAAPGAAGRSQRDFKYNAAVSFFKAGRFDDAARVLKDLNLSTLEADARTSKALGASSYRAAEARSGNDSTNLVEKARLMKEAGEAFRNAARAESANEDSRHNLALALEKLPDLEEQARIARLLSQYGKTPPAELASRLLGEQRQVIDGTAQALTNASPQQIKVLESLSEKQKAAADLWIPLKGTLLQAMAQQGGGTNQNQLAALDQAVEATRDSMQGAAARLRDLDPEALDAAVRSEAATYQFWKGMAPFEQVLQEDLRVQTNALARTHAKLNASAEPPAPLRPEQPEASSLTHMFIDRFSRSVPETGLPAPQAPGQTGPQAQPPDGKPPASTNQLITAETRRKILELAEQAVAAQERAAGLLTTNDLAGALPQQTLAHERLREIEKLLPKQQQQQNQEQQQNQQPPPDPQQKPEERKPEEQKPEEEQKDQTPEDVKRQLEKALQREKEHEAEKKRLQRQMPMLPREKDW